MLTRKTLTLVPLSLCLMMSSACSTQKVKPTPTQVVEVPVLRFVPVPETLTRPTQEPVRLGTTYQALALWIVSWRDSLKACNDDKAAIAKLEKKP